MCASVVMVADTCMGFLCFSVLTVCAWTVFLGLKLVDAPQASGRNFMGWTGCCLRQKQTRQRACLVNNGAKFVLVISTSWRSYIGFTLSMNWNFDKSCFALIRSELMLSTQYDSQWKALRELSHEQRRTHTKKSSPTQIQSIARHLECFVSIQLSVWLSKLFSMRRTKNE